MLAWVDAGALKAACDEADTMAPLESGGVLIGYWNQEEAVVLGVSGPGPEAQHGRHTFVPDAQFQQAFISRKYEESGRTITYLGDWHSHPRGSSQLSCVDRKTMNVIARSRLARAPRPLMMILADGEPWTAAIWLRQDRLLRLARFQELEVRSF